MDGSILIKNIMSKKFNIISLLVLYFVFLSFSAFSEDKCTKFFNELKNDYEKYIPEFFPKWEFNDIGFELKKKWNEEKETWEYYQDENGYYVLGKFTDNNLVGKMSYNDKIISANNIDLRDKNLDNYEYIFPDLFEDDENVKIIFENKNLQREEITLKKFKRNLIEPFSDFYIRSLKIDEDNNIIEARILIEASHSFADDDPMYELAKELLWISSDDGNDDTEACNFEASDWDKALFANPGGGFEFDNLHSSNFDTFQNGIYLKPYSQEIGWHKDLGWENELYIEYFEDGIHFFNTDFKYHNFPFDKQTISFKIINQHEMPDGILGISDYTKKYLLDLVKQNKITGWNIIDNRIVYDHYKSPIHENYTSTVSLELDIERKSGYYLYKVILPIIIILIVCWSSIWIAPKELESKLTIAIVCLLSLIAYNFVTDNDIPKLDYLTTIDWIILSSYFYAALPNILGIYFYTLFKKRKFVQLNKYESIAKRYGLLSYLAIVFSIILLNVSINYENASTMFSWMTG